MHAFNLSVHIEVGLLPNIFSRIRQLDAQNMFRLTLHNSIRSRLVGRV